MATPSTLTELLTAETPASRDLAWQRFVAQYSRLILSVSRGVDRDYDAAMDRYTYILEQLRRDNFRRLGGYSADPRCKFTTWLVVVCRRLSIDYNRSRFGRVRASTDVIELRARRSLAQSLFSSAELETLVAPDYARPDVLAEERELHSRLDHCLSRLEAADRLLIKLRFEDEMPALDIMRLLRMPTPFHVYRRINRLLKDLRAAITLGTAPSAASQKSATRPLHLEK